MKKPSIQKLKSLFVAVAGCRECNLPAGYVPQLRPPGPGYHFGGIVFGQINPIHNRTLVFESEKCLPQELLSLLKIGSLCHIGKGTTQGSGGYSLL